ncbi:MAG TPA: hypothetical protein VMZ02_04750 [Candidatus Limnocylindrales bacterium]|nr:hypothetical protein [Candidatus Limnocylindrales bacterium]
MKLMRAAIGSSFDGDKSVDFVATLIALAASFGNLDGALVRSLRAMEHDKSYY